MSLGIDPFVTSLLFSAGLLPHATTTAARRELASQPPADFPYVSVIVALHREKWVDVEMTTLSLLNQSYPKSKYEVLLVVEADDSDVRAFAAIAVNRLQAAGISAQTVVSDGRRRLKAYALNHAIDEARGEFCAFYDASDTIEDAQIEKAVSLMVERNYDAAQCTVLRSGRSVLSRILFIDTVFWFTRYLPFILGRAHGIPLSGEGLFVRTKTLKEVGGFPEVLTEDAFLGIILAEQGKSFGLVASTIIEKAPRNIKSHFVQRLRWNRGYLTCLVRLLRSTMPIGRKSVFLIPFIAPLSCALAFWGWVLIAAHWAFPAFPSLPGFTSWLPDYPVYSRIVYVWSTMLFTVGIPLCVSSYARTLWKTGMRKHIPFLALLPYYWTFIGLAATCSFLRGTSHWGKTER